MDRYKPIGPQLLTRFQSDAVQRVQLKQIQKPDLSEILDISRSENFSLFLPKHRRIAGRLINIFLSKLISSFVLISFGTEKNEFI